MVLFVLAVTKNVQQINKLIHVLNFFRWGSLLCFYVFNWEVLPYIHDQIKEALLVYHVQVAPQPWEEPVRQTAALSISDINKETLGAQSLPRRMHHYIIYMLKF